MCSSASCSDPGQPSDQARLFNAFSSHDLKTPRFWGAASHTWGDFARLLLLPSCLPNTCHTGSSLVSLLHLWHNVCHYVNPHLDSICTILGFFLSLLGCCTSLLINIYWFQPHSCPELSCICCLMMPEDHELEIWVYFSIPISFSHLSCQMTNWPHFLLSGIWATLHCF